MICTVLQLQVLLAYAEKVWHDWVGRNFQLTVPCDFRRCDVEIRVTT